MSAHEPHKPAAADNEPTDLPWARSWPALYWLVFGCFVLYVVLLAIFTQTFSG